MWISAEEFSHMVWIVLSGLTVWFCVDVDKEICAHKICGLRCRIVEGLFCMGVFCVDICKS